MTMKETFKRQTNIIARSLEGSDLHTNMLSLNHLPTPVCGSWCIYYYILSSIQL